MVGEPGHISRVRIGVFPRLVLVALAVVGQAARAQVSADSVRPFLVFAPVGERWFVAANRGKRMLLDIGRVDLPLGRDSTLFAAFRAAAGTRTTVPVGTRFTLHLPWGRENARAIAIDAWNGRIVLVLAGSARLDSAAAGEGPVVAGAERLIDSGAGGRPPSAPRAAALPACDRESAAAQLAPRIEVIRDSLERVLRAEGPPPFERLGRRLTVASSHVTGCFGRSRTLLVVSLRAPVAEWSRERAVLLDSLGRATTVVLEDLRFQVHDLLQAFDADGDGVDDVAAVGRRHRAGGTTILRFDVTRRRFARLAAGFAWEDF
jgi:hypothetical protein